MNRRTFLGVVAAAFAPKPATPVVSYEAMDRAYHDAVVPRLEPPFLYAPMIGGAYMPGDHFHIVGWNPVDPNIDALNAVTRREIWRNDDPPRSDASADHEARDPEDRNSATHGQRR